VGGKNKKTTPGMVPDGAGVEGNKFIGLNGHGAEVSLMGGKGKKLWKIFRVTRGEKKTQATRKMQYLLRLDGIWAVKTGKFRGKGKKKITKIGAEPLKENWASKPEKPNNE